jgi:hypothetical protein
VEVDMKKRLLITLLVAFVAAAATGPSGTRQAKADDPAAPPGSLLPLINQAMLDAIPAPADDPLLDANGAIVRDPLGNPVSDPSEGFHKVIPGVFDPANTHLVQSTWLDGIGCPTEASVAAYPSTTATGTYTDPACPVGATDPKDKHNEGLLLVKTGTLSNNAAAGAELKKVRGLTLNELGYDIRKHDGSGGVVGSHCDGGAPRFDVFTTDGYWAVACTSPPPNSQSPSVIATRDGFTRLRWGAAGVVMGYKDNSVLSPITGTVQRIQIVFDEATDSVSGADQFGLAVLDNIDVNGMLVGRGPTGKGMQEDQSKDDDDDD